MENIKEIKDFKILGLLDKFKIFFQKTGVNYNVMRKLLQLMLIMDGRKTTIMGSQKKIENESCESNPFKGYIINYGLLGVLIMILMILPFSLFYKMSLCFGMIIFMLITTMISDFSGILLDIKDKAILSPKPIDFKTLNMARTIHIIIYLLVISASIAGPSFLAGSIKYGLRFSLIFFVQLFFIVIFVIFLTSIFYFLILQFFDGEKIKDIINFFQILLSITMAVEYQFLGRAFNLLKTDFILSPNWWIYILPPIWFSAPYSYILEGNKQTVYLILSLLGMLVPVILLIIYYAKISPYFERNLQKLNRISIKKSSSIEKRYIFKKRLLNIICPDKFENAFYRFTGSMISNERQLKLKLYPSLAYAALFPFIFFLNMFTSSKSFEENITSISHSPDYLNIYFAVMILSGLYVTIYSSEKYKCSWIYRTLPLKNPSPIYKASLKCFLAKYVLPILLFLGLVFYLFYGPAIIPHLIAIFISLMILTLINFKISPKKLPFGTEFWQQNKEPQSGTGCLMIFINGLCCGIGASAEYLISKLNYGIYIYIAVLLAMFILLCNILIKISWTDIVEISD